MILLNGKKIARKIQSKLKKEIARKKIQPTLAIILVGESKISKVYIREKEKVCREVGIKLKKYLLKESIGEKKILALVDELNDNPKITAILVQLPLPASYDTDKILNKVLPEKDVDGLGNKPLVIAPTAQAIMEIFREYNINLKNKKICLIGYGRLVGKPLAKILKKQKFNFVICTSKTENLSQKTKFADIIISATGKAGLLGPGMIKKNVIIIDAGTTEIAGKVRGDTNIESLKDKVSYITPSKGGVGPVTVAKLLENVVKLAKIKVKKE